MGLSSEKWAAMKAIVKPDSTPLVRPGTTGVRPVKKKRVNKRAENLRRQRTHPNG